MKTVFASVVLIVKLLGAAESIVVSPLPPIDGSGAVLPLPARKDRLIQPAHSPLISAHRGASRVAPENTLASFTKAMQMGCDFIEVDVRTTSDGVQVCMHDSSLKRTTGLDSAVADVSYERMRKLSAGSWFGRHFKNERVPSLAEVCRLVAEHNRVSDHPVNLYVDCKDVRAEVLTRLLRAHGLLKGAVFYGNVETLASIRQIAPQSQLMPPYPGREREGEVIDTLHPFAFDVSWSDVDANLVSHCHSNGIQVFSDLLDAHDAPAQYRKAIAVGIDLIQTDDINSVKRCIEEYQKNEFK